jgi:Trk K+ transport system NAD-binding subunit
VKTPAERPIRLWMVTAGLCAVAAVLGYVGFADYLKGQPEFAGAGVFDRVYYTGQLFLLSSTPLNDPPYGPMLSIAMYLAPLATVLAVLEAISAVFRARLAAWMLLRERGHSVVVGSGLAAFVLARRLAETRPTVLVGSGIGSDVARRHEVRVVDGDPTDEATLRAAGVRGAAQVFALDASGAVNAEVALLVRSLSQAGVAVYARADEGELVAALRARRLGVDGHNGYRLDFFSIEDLAAVALLDIHDRDLERTALVVGSDRFAQAVERNLIQRRRRAGVPVAGRVVRVDDGASGAGSAGTVYVSARDANDVLRRGLQLLLSGNDRVVLCLAQRSGLADALEQRLFDDVQGRLAVFGVLDAACDPALLERGALVERLARAMHARYLVESAGSSPGQDSHVPWDQLDERYRADNRAQAEHIGTKLAQIDAVIVPEAPDLPPFTLSEGPQGDVEKLARMEHDRWMAARRQAGVTYGEERTTRTHPDMLDWDAGLSEDAKEKDRMFVRGLPALLEAEGLAIVRLPRSHQDG